MSVHARSCGLDTETLLWVSRSAAVPMTSAGGYNPSRDESGVIDPATVPQPQSDGPLAVEQGWHLERDFPEILSGRPAEAEMLRLSAAEDHWRTALLEAVRFHAREWPGRPDGDALIDLDPAMALIAAATSCTDEMLRGRVQWLLRYPSVGIWAATMVRALCRPQVGDAAELRKRLSYLNAIAAAAAIQAQLPFSLRLPVWDGWLVLPGIGALLLPEGDTNGAPWVAVESDGFRMCAAGVELEGDPWYELPILADSPGRVVLDRMDPFRSVRGMLSPMPVRGHEAESWRSVFEQSSGVLRALGRGQGCDYLRGLACIVPEELRERFRPHSVSCADGTGGFTASFQDEPLQFAGTLVHEGQHSRLSMLAHLFDVFGDPSASATRLQYYAGWRDDPRPLAGMLQGVYAFAGVADYWSWQAETSTNEDHGGGDYRALARFEAELWSQQVVRAARELLHAEGLTEPGRLMLGAVLRRIQSSVRTPGRRLQGTDQQAITAARICASDHQAAWFARHRQPDAARVAELALAWTCGYPLPLTPSEVTAELQPSTDGAHLDARAVLWRHRLDPVGGPRLDPGLVGAVEGADRADFDLVNGDAAQALRGYRERAERGADAQAWVGLGLALRAAAPASLAPAADLLLHRPELAMAVHAASDGHGDPVALAAWLAG
ncbi:HEXXH motif-containing protein [Streptacidiphilus jiangxiensis]|uniref:HEXXH motif-containing protein n=2 Tax=Streptacidiphilus jiangxiensis TaxID=235985 RepID=A0A1H7NS17_STRJI|nr:HEXXH motif-containing protein [Streptacidiphilus jiangxiensis]